MAAIVVLVLGCVLAGLLSGTGVGAGPSGSPELQGGLTVSAYPTYGVAPLLVAFDAVPPNGSPPAISWSFGDGQYLNGTGSSFLTPSHEYVVPGKYNATVIATWGAKSLNATLTVVAVADHLRAVVVATPLDGLAPLTVQFNGSATGGEAPYTAYLWSFGDGGLGSGPAVRYTYLSPGPFVAVLTVNDSAGYSATASVNVSVATTLLDVAIVATPSTGVAPLPVMFEAVPTGGSLTYLSYNWTFGDGTAGAGPSIEHTFGSPGRFVVEVQVADSASDVANDWAAVVVTAPTFGLSIAPSSTTGVAPFPVHFVADPVGGTAPFVAFDWSFGDGALGSGLSVNHTYLSAGTFVVSLTAEDAWQTNVTTAIDLKVTASNVSAPPGPAPTTQGPPSSSAGGPSFLGVSVLAWGAIAAGVAALGITAMWTLASRARHRGDPDSPPSAGPLSPLGPVYATVPDPSLEVEVEEGPPGNPIAAPVADVGTPGEEAAATAPKTQSEEVRTFAGQRQLALRLIARLANLPRLGPDAVPTLEWTQAGLAQRLGVGTSAVSKVLRRLTAAGIVESETVHVTGSVRRTRAYHLTARGERLGRSLPDPRAAGAAEVVGAARDATAGTLDRSSAATERASRSPFVASGSRSDAK